MVILILNLLQVIIVFNMLFKHFNINKQSPNRYKPMFCADITSALLVTFILLLLPYSQVNCFAVDVPTPTGDKHQRLGIWDFEEGYITHIRFRDDLHLVMYLVNPEGAAIWELDLTGPSKTKTVTSTFFSNLTSSPGWFANTDARFSLSTRYLLIWQTSGQYKTPPCVLLKFDTTELVEAISLDVPPDTQILSADFSYDDRYLLISNHPVTNSGPELILFDLNKKREFGILKPTSHVFFGAPALIGVLRFCPISYDLLLSSAIYKSISYSPPLLVRISLDNPSDYPLIQGSLLKDGLIPHEFGCSILLDPRTVAGKSGLDPNNWWQIPNDERLAKRVCDLKGQFEDVWTIGANRYAALFRPRSNSGALGDTRFILLDNNKYTTLATSVRLAACSDSGKTSAVVMKNSNRLEIFAISKYKTD